MVPLTNRLIAEFIGTFFLVLTVGLTVIGGGSGVIPPLAIGSALMIMVYATGHTSGGHLNPAVTLGVMLRGRLAKTDAVPYMVAQVVGAAVAALIVKYLKADVEVKAGTLVTAHALIVEFLFTFALVFVVLNSATSKDTQGNSFYGLAIGFTVLAGAFAAGSISGAAFNPAVAVGVSVMGLSAWPSLWIFLLADFAGGIVAATAFKVLNPADK